MSRCITKLIRDYHFWLVLVIVAAIALAHHFTREPLPMLHEALEYLIVLPVIYAAFRFGIRGALLTAVLIGVAILVSGFLDFDFNEISGDLVMVAIAIGIAAILGRLVDREKAARKKWTRTAIELTKLIDTANAQSIGFDRNGWVNECNQKGADSTRYSNDEQSG